MDGKLKPCNAAELVIREQFKKDYKMSCPLIDDQDAFIKSLRIGGLEKDWKAYLNMSRRYPDFENYRKKIRNRIVQTIQRVPGYEQLEKTVAEKYGGPSKYNGPRTFLRPEVIGSRLVSIDLVTGNYQSFHFLDRNLVLNTDNYEDLIQKFTKESSLVRSKYFRQMIFGLLKPDTQAILQRYMITQAIDTIFAKQQFNIEHLTNDEVVFKIQNGKQGDNELALINKLIKDMPHVYRVKEFYIQKIPNKNNEPWFVRYIGEEKKIMGVHVKFLFQVYNWLEGIPNGQKDFWWRERGRLCSLMDPEIFEEPVITKEKQEQKEQKEKEKI